MIGPVPQMSQTSGPKFFPQPLAQRNELPASSSAVRAAKRISYVNKSYSNFNPKIKEEDNEHEDEKRFNNNTLSFEFPKTGLKKFVANANDTYIDIHGDDDHALKEDEAVEKDSAHEAPTPNESHHSKEPSSQLSSKRSVPLASLAAEELKHSVSHAR